MLKIILILPFLTMRRKKSNVIRKFFGNEDFFHSYKIKTSKTVTNNKISSTSGINYIFDDIFM